MAARKARKRYHHGDLRAAVLGAAVDLIAKKGLQALSLRECARRLGVSHAAPYRHFANKDALLFAIVEEGLAMLADAGSKAMEGIEDPQERLDAYGVAYVRFAFEHPVHLRVMFTSEVEDAAPSRGVSPAFDLLLETASAAAGPGVDDMLAAIAGWALPHGLAMLILDRRIPKDHVSTAEDVEAFARAVFAQARPRP